MWDVATLMQKDICARPCTGMAPSGSEWSYVMYPHTGTGTVAGFLDSAAQRAALNLSHGCMHDHRPCVGSRVDTVVAFVANPFRVVLSTAATLGIVAGSHTEMWARHGQHPEITNRTVEQQVLDFRKFVHSAWTWPGHRSAGGTKTNSVGTFSLLSRGVWHERKPTQLTFLRNTIATSNVRHLMLGRTAALQDDLRRILKRLGYTEAPVNFSKFHCAASCPLTMGQHHKSRGAPRVFTLGSFEEVVGGRLEAVKQTRWYDEVSAQKVAAMFALDFNAFNFSMDKRDVRGAAVSTHSNARARRPF